MEARNGTISLSQRFRAGEGAAEAEVRARVRRILAYRGYGIPPEDRLDLEQTIMLQLWQAVSEPSFRGKRFGGLVEVVASRRCIDWWRSRKPETALEAAEAVPAGQPDPQRTALRREQIEHAQAALKRLPAACQELIRLHVGQNRSYAEIAKSLGRSEGALRVQMHRCIRRAQQLLLAVLGSADPPRR